MVIRPSPVMCGAAMKTTQIIIVTGLSGSGKSTALRALEDAGYFCIDNLPVALLPKLLDLKSEFGPGNMRLGMVMDIREKGFAATFPKVFHDLKTQGYQMEMLFLDASDKTILQRFSHTKRQHPISGSTSVLEKIHTERQQLEPVKVLADRDLDTSNYNIHELRQMVFQYYSPETYSDRMNIQVLSFGYKYGLPHEADLVIDVRFLPNPFYVSHLRPKNGTDPEVAAYVMETPEARMFLDRYADLLQLLIPLYRKEGKSYLTLAVGCTGGRHRSVAVASALYERLKQLDIRATLRFRDINGE